MTSRCEAELCPRWTGHGCICAVMGIEPERCRCSCHNCCIPLDASCEDCEDNHDR